MKKTKTTLEPSLLPPDLRPLFKGATVYATAAAVRKRVCCISTQDTT